MYQIFISYRRNGSEFLGKILYDRLTASGYSVFFDVESLRSGTFNDKLFEHIDNCTDFILLLPQNALDRCITDPNDWVLMEISRAIRMKKNIIPVMMRGFIEYPMNLPSSIASLPNYEALNAREHEYFDAAYNKLITHFLDSRPNNSVNPSGPFPVTISERLTGTVMSVMSYLKKAELNINDFLLLYLYKIEYHDIMKYFPSDDTKKLLENTKLESYMSKDLARKHEALRPLAVWISELPEDQLRELDNLYTEIKSLRYIFKKDGTAYRMSSSMHFVSDSLTWDVMDVFMIDTVKWLIATTHTDSLIPELGVFQVTENSVVRIHPKNPDYVGTLLYYVCFIRLMDVFPSYVIGKLGNSGKSELKEFLNQLIEGLDLGMLLDNNEFRGNFFVTGDYIKKGWLHTTVNSVIIGTERCYTFDKKTLKHNHNTPFGKEQLLDIVKLRDQVQDDSYFVLTSTLGESGISYFADNPHIYEIHIDPDSHLLDYKELKADKTASTINFNVLERFALRLHFYRLMGVVK